MRIGKVGFDRLGLHELVAEVVTRGLSGHRSVLAFANAEFVIQADHDEELEGYLERADFVVADGMSIVYASRLLPRMAPLPERVTGTDFVPALCDASVTHGLRLFFLGGSPGVADAAKTRLQALHPGVVICGTADGYGDMSDPPRLLQRINDAAPHVLMVCLGCPAQERFIARYQRELRVPILFGNGGALDFWSGRRKRAPSLLQRSGLEWLYRLLQDPTAARARRQLGLWRLFPILLRTRTNSAR